jgi:hypothetical protein
MSAQIKRFDVLCVQDADSGDWETYKDYDENGDFIYYTDHIAHIDSLMETFVNVANYLGIDTEAAKSAPGKPSDVFIAAIQSLHAYDEEKERVLFEAAMREIHKGDLRNLESWHVDGYYVHHIQEMWDLWKSCAKARAKAGGE